MNAAKKGGLVGLAIGTTVSTVATIWGGYEVGTLINDYIGLQNTFLRGTLDFTVMCMAAKPIFYIGLYGATGIGLAMGAISESATRHTRSLTDKLSENRQRSWVEIADEEDSLGTY